MHSHASDTKRAWLWGVLVASGLWLFLFAFCDVHFGVNDDQFLLRTFVGASPSGPSTFHLYWLALYCYPLAWLSRLFPGLPWVTVTEIFLMWLSTATIVKSLYQCFARQGRTALGSLFGVCFVLLFQLYLGARLTYTTVAASLGAACVAQVLSADCENATDGQIVRAMLYALVLMVLCYGLRQMVALPVLAFCGVAFLQRIFTCFGFGEQAKRRLRPMVISLVAVAGVMGGLAVAREAELTLRQQREYLDWQQSRISVIDYLDLKALTPDECAQLGWTPTQAQLLSNWYTMEETISTENFRFIAQNYDNAVTRTSPGVAILDFRTRSPLVALSLVVLFVLGMGCVVGLMLRRRGLWTFLALVCTAVGSLLLLLYLALQGRLPYRAVMVPVLPSAALVFCLVPECLPKKRWFALCLCLVLVAGTALYTAGTLHDVWYRKPKWDYNTHAAMDEIALEHPDLLFIYSNELVNDMRIAPDFLRGIPQNLMFWGGWQRGSAEYRGKMEAFGLDSDHFTAADWINPSLRFLTLATEPDALLVAHLREQLGNGLRWQQEKMDVALYAYRFYLAEDE